jgi:hypothetical protein
MRLIAFLSGAVLRILFRAILELLHQFKQGQIGSDQAKQYNLTWTNKNQKSFSNFESVA